MAFFQAEPIDLVQYLGVGTPPPPLVLNAANNILYMNYDLSGFQNWTNLVLWFKVCDSISSTNGMPSSCSRSDQDFTDAFFCIGKNQTKAALQYGNPGDNYKDLYQYSSDKNDFQCPNSGVLWVALQYTGQSYGDMNFWAGTDPQMTSYTVDGGNSTCQRFHSNGSIANNYILHQIRVFGPGINDGKSFEPGDVIIATYTGDNQYGMPVKFGQASISNIRVISDQLAVCMGFISSKNTNFATKYQPGNPGCTQSMYNYCGPLKYKAVRDPQTGKTYAGVPEVPVKGPGFNDPQCACLTSLVPNAICLDPVCANQESYFPGTSRADACKGITEMTCEQIIIAKMNHVDIKGKGFRLQSNCDQHPTDGGGGSDTDGDDDGDGGDDGNNGNGGDHNRPTKTKSSELPLFAILGGAGLVFVFLILILVVALAS